MIFDFDLKFNFDLRFIKALLLGNSFRSLQGRGIFAGRRNLLPRHYYFREYRQNLGAKVA